MKMIIGLGNPGSKYAKTKHNIGFMALDKIAYRYGTAFNKTKFEAVYAEVRVANEKILLIKPQTFMNDSGRAVRPFLDYFQVDLKDLLIIYDDLDLPVGKVRLRQKGSAGGHNGIKSVIQYIGTQAFNRIKIGIDHPMRGHTVVQHVLSTFPKEQQADITESLKLGTEAVDYWIEGYTFLDTMSKFN